MSLAVSSKGVNLKNCNCIFVWSVQTSSWKSPLLGWELVLFFHFVLNFKMVLLNFICFIYVYHLFKIFYLRVWVSFCICVCISCVVEKLWSLPATSPEKSFLFVKHGLDFSPYCRSVLVWEGFYCSRFPGLLVHPQMSWLWLDFHGAGKHDFRAAFCQHEIEKSR